jgi:hypothetical protein
MALGYFLHVAIYWMLPFYIFLPLYSYLSSTLKGISFVRKHLIYLPKVLQRIETLFTTRKLLQDGYNKVSRQSDC